MQRDSNKIVFLNGKRIYLRPVLKADIPSTLRWINDEEVIQYISVYLPMFEVDEERWFENLVAEKHTSLTFTIVLRDNDKIIGNMAIHDISWKDRVAFTGALIGEKEYWGQGYGTEAKMILLNYAFNTLNLRKICSSVFSKNKRSRAYQKKCGYMEEGRLRKQDYCDGHYHDRILTAVFKKDWLPLWKKYRKQYL